MKRGQEGGDCTRSGIREYQPVVWLNTLSSRKMKYCSPKKTRAGGVPTKEVVWRV